MAREVELMPVVVWWWCLAIAKGGREGGVKVAVGLSGSVDRVKERERERERKWRVTRLRRLSFCHSADSVAMRMLI